MTIGPLDDETLWGVPPAELPEAEPKDCFEPWVPDFEDLSDEEIDEILRQCERPEGAVEL